MLVIFLHNSPLYFFFFFFFNDTATTEIYTLSLHDALPILSSTQIAIPELTMSTSKVFTNATGRSEEHTSELQSRQYLVCRLLLEKKKLQYIMLKDIAMNKDVSNECY